MSQLTLSTLVTAQHPNELFKFMHVRNPITPPELQEQALFFTYNWSWASDNTNRFLHTLQTMRNNWASWADLVAAANTFKNSGNPLYISSEWSLSVLPNAKFLTAVARFMDKNTNAEHLSAAFAAALPNLLPGQITSYLADPQTHQAELQLWDSVAISAVLNDPDDSHWLAPGQLEVLNAQRKAVNVRQPLFAQLPDGIAFVVPVIQAESPVT